jgi:hypothetical protein
VKFGNSTRVALVLAVQACSDAPTLIDNPGGDSCPTAAPCGRLNDAQAARDIIAWNMNAAGGSSFRTLGIIARWELPVPVLLRSDLTAADSAAAIDALNYWQSAAGLRYVLVSSSNLPRMLIRPGTDGLAPQGGGRALIDGTFSNNRAQSGLVVFEPGGGQYCRTSAQLCRYLFRHEIGHALGFLAHSTGGLMASGPDVLSDRERQMITALYSLPHGTKVNEDGSWTVVVQ